MGAVGLTLGFVCSVWDAALWGGWLESAVLVNKLSDEIKLARSSSTSSVSRPPREGICKLCDWEVSARAIVKTQNGGHWWINQ